MTTDDESVTALIPGILTAVRDGRDEDADDMADDLVEQMGDVSAVLAMAIYANFLHTNPEVPLEQVAMMLSAHRMGMELIETRTDGEIVAELLPVIEELTRQDDPSEASQAILERWGARQSSPALMELLCRMLALSVNDMKLQSIGQLFAARTPDAKARFAIADARSVALGDGPLNLHGQEWNDQ